MFDTKTLRKLEDCWASLPAFLKEKQNSKDIEEGRLIVFHRIVDKVQSTKTFSKDFEKRMQPYIKRWGLNYIKAYFIEYGKFPEL